MKALDLALRVEDAGAAAVIYADINRDGALGEVNIEAIIDLAFALNTPVIASGGVNSLQDLADLKAHAKTGIAGLILGGALYSGKIKAEEALALAAA
jgi:phosphoribosylformimino-5-aminoimidazole carboxamide ribotide isomerase